MIFFKTAAILLIAAIANPFCCCLAGMDTLEEASEYHGCCEAVKDTQNEAATQHNPDNCPHEAEKGAQIVENADSGSALVKLIDFVVFDFPGILGISETNFREEFTARAIFAERAIPDTPLAQTYCVYLL
ncbi:hypothetical protein MLD52_09695 [Puniceicoccaceae bacterium K14]|nr:hypothetical protein [Puniceicoccaceae bacterium K14]